MRLASNCALAALVLALFLSACGGSSPAATPIRTGNLTSADEVLAAARDALSSVISYRSETHMVVKNLVDGRKISEGTFTLTWSAPDRIHLLIEGSKEGEEAQRSEYISTDGRVMVRHSATGNIWVEYDTDTNPDNGEVRGILAMVERFSVAPDLVPTMDEGELVGKTVIDGLSVYHVKGTSSLRSEPPDDWPADVKDDFPRQQNVSKYDLYVSSDDLLLRRLVSTIELTFEFSEGEEPRVEQINTVATADFLDYNAPVTIEFPEVR